MTFRMRFMDAFFKPSHFNYELKYAETMTRHWLTCILLIIASVALFAVEAYAGIGTHIFANEFTQLAAPALEMRKLLFGVGQIIFGFTYPLLIIFVPAFIFWLFFEVDFRKVFVVQQVVFFILLFEKALLFPLEVRFGIEAPFSPFAFGVLSNTLSWNELVTHSLGVISIFKIAAVIYQYRMLHAILKGDKREIFLFVLVVNVVFIVIATFVSYVPFDRLF